MTILRAGRTLSLTAAAVLLLALAPSGATAAIRAGLGGRINPVKVKRGQPLRLTITFTLDPLVAGEGQTVSRVILDFPNNAVHNGHLFPSCSAAAINVRRSYRQCPKGSLIGRGRLRADVPGAGVYNVPGVVTLFNGPRGRSITVHIYSTNPVLLKEAFDAPIRRTRGRYGYRLIADVPEILQEINGEGGGYFAQLRWLTSTVSAFTRVRGKRRGYIEAKSCPKNGRAPIAGGYWFRSGISTSTTGYVACKAAGRPARKGRRARRRR